MKHLYLGLILLTFSCNEQVEPLNTEVETERPSDSIISINEISEIDYLSRIDTIILGDINFDNVIDTAIVYPPKFINPDDIMQGVYGNYDIIKIHFSHDDSWLYKDGSIGLTRLYVLDDINEDGIKEIALIPDWFFSCLAGFFVYSNHNGIWQNISRTSVYRCGDIEHDVTKVRKNKFIVPDRVYSLVAEDIIDTIKTVKFPKFEPDVYNVIVDSISFPIMDNVVLLKPHLLGLVALYSGIAGSQCDKESCELTRALNLGKHGTDKQLNLIKKYFPNNDLAQSVISNKCYVSPSGASVSSEYCYLKLTDYGNKVIVDYEIIYHNRGTFIEETYRDVYVYKNGIFKAKTSKVLKTRAYTFEDIGEN